MARRGSGEGTILKRKACEACGKITSSKDNDRLAICKCGAELPNTCTWMAALNVGFDHEKAKPLRRYFYGKTRAEVLEKMSEVQQRVGNGLIAEPSKMFFAEWIDIWLNEYMRPPIIRPTTWESYEAQVRKHIKPALGHLRLNELRTDHLQKLYNDKHSSGLSARSVKYIHTVIHGALNQARDEGKILRNPAEHVKVPKQDKKEIQYFDTEAVGKFLNAAHGTDYFPAYYLELATGLRRGELLGLRWKDVDLESGTVTVNQGLVRTKQGLIFQKPKTKLANRTISIPVEVVGVLKMYQSRWKVMKDDAGEGWHNNDLLFCSKLGKPLDPRSFTHHFERLLKKAGLPKITFHGLRHTYATMNLQEGVDIKTTQENLGHHSASFTLDVYSSVTDKMKKSATDKIGKLLNSCMNSNG
jgi:integrase